MIHFESIYHVTVLHQLESWQTLGFSRWCSQPKLSKNFRFCRKNEWSLLTTSDMQQSPCFGIGLHSALCGHVLWSPIYISWSYNCIQDWIFKQLCHTCQPNWERRMPIFLHFVNSTQQKNLHNYTMNLFALCIGTWLATITCWRHFQIPPNFFFFFFFLQLLLTLRAKKRKERFLFSRNRVCLLDSRSPLLYKLCEYLLILIFSFILQHNIRA